jgi:hypothetical protein
MGAYGELQLEDSQFDKLSRSVSEQGVVAAILAVGAAALTTMVTGWAHRAEAQPNSAPPCDATILRDCVTKTSNQVLPEFEACARAGMSLADPVEISKFCVACIEAISAKMQNTDEACHQAACGGTAGARCQIVGLGGPFADRHLCCPFGSHATRISGTSYQCMAGCGFFCAQPLKLDTRWCRCVS